MAFGAPGQPPDEPHTDQQEGVDAIAMAIRALAVLPKPLWLAVVIPANPQISTRGFFRTLASQFDEDLSSVLQGIGERLVITVKLDQQLQPDHDLLRILGSYHALGAIWDEGSAIGVRTSLPLKSQHVFMSPDLVSGIAVDSRLQRQWLFVSDALGALAIPLVAIGSCTPSECAWLLRHGCQQIAHLERACQLETFLADYA